MPKNTDHHYLAADFFNHQALELSFRLLRNNHPLLARALKKTIDEIQCVPFEELHAAYTGEMILNTELLNLLDVETIGKIVSTLTHLGQDALHHQHLPPEHLRILRSLIEDWVQLMEWILNNSIADQTNKDLYH
jgi:hypothetical protein